MSNDSTNISFYFLPTQHAIHHQVLCEFFFPPWWFGGLNPQRVGSDPWLGQWVGPGNLDELHHAFSPGVDLMDMASDILQPKGDDVARISWYLRDIITRCQETFNVIEKVTVGGWRASLSMPASPGPALTPLFLFPLSAPSP